MLILESRRSPTHPTMRFLDIMNFVLAFISTLLIPNPLSAYGVEGNAGIRHARALSPTRLLLHLGPGCAKNEFAKKPHTIQIVSGTDKDFSLGVKCTSARITKQLADAVYPAGWVGPKFQKMLIEVESPVPMKAEHRYWVRVNSPWLVARNTAAKWITKEPLEESDEARYGIRELYQVTSKLLHVMTGSGFDLKNLSSANIHVTSKDDADFSKGVTPVRVGRRSNLDFYYPSGWPWRFEQRHELFLELPQAMTPGKTYEVNLNAREGMPVTCGMSKATLTFDERHSKSLAIKVNQSGYLPAARKHGYCGMWAGDLNAVDFADWAGTFQIRNAETHQTVFESKPTVRGKAVYRLENGMATPDPKKVKGPETVYKNDLSYEDVYELDFSACKEPGEYYVAIPGIGRSFSFRINDDVYVAPFKTIMSGVFHQRCGIEFKPPYSSRFRPPCHRNKTEYSTFRHGDKDPFRNLVKHATDGKKHDLFGGHHDAGDWNPRSHIEVAEQLFLLWELNGEAFTDNQLNLPENKNGIPDIIDEAMWALDLWSRLQDDDGGVHHGIESNGDPLEGDSAATDTLREFAFAKDAAGSYRFAAVAAHASKIFKKLGKTKEATEWLARALNAYDWADANGGEKEHDQHAYAAAMLMYTSEKIERFDVAFKQHSIYSKKSKANPMEWNKYDQLFGSYYYAKHPKADLNLKRSIVASFENLCRFWVHMAGTTRYRYMRSPYAPNSWGTGGLPKDLDFPAMTMHLTKDAKLKAACMDWIRWTNDFSLGCHPMNLTFTIGVGQRSVSTAFHHLNWLTPGDSIPGLQCEAPGGRFISGSKPSRGGMGAWPGMSMYPPGPWPDLYKYSENASPGMNEGIIKNMAKTAFAYGLMVK
jgi:endoglucanase